MAMAFMACRSASAGWIIIAASTPSRAPRSVHEDLAAAALLGRCAEDDDPAAELVGDGWPRRGRRRGRRWR